MSNTTKVNDKRKDEPLFTPQVAIMASELGFVDMFGYSRNLNVAMKASTDMISKLPKEYQMQAFQAMYTYSNSVILKIIESDDLLATIHKAKELDKK